MNHKNLTRSKDTLSANNLRQLLKEYR